MKRFYLLLLSISAIFVSQLHSRTNDDIYSQSISVEYSSAEDAKKATAKILQFPNDKKIAFSTRWDDTNTRHLLTAQMLAKHNMFASCYLVGDKFNEQQKNIFDEVLKIGGSIGAHTLSHPHLGTLMQNEIFREIALERPILESTFDTNVVGFVLPYMTYSSPLDNNVKHYIALSIINAGYRVCPEVTLNFNTRYSLKKSEMLSSFTFNVNDRNPDRNLMLKRIENGRKKITKGFEPHITLGIHSWHNDTAREKLGTLIDEVKSDDFWFCNENDYVAYRTHFLKSKIVKIATKGNIAIFELRRIAATYIGSDIPISITFSNSPKSVKIGGSEITSKNGIYNIEHYCDRKIPQKIDMIKFQENSDKIIESNKFKGLKFSFNFNRIKEEVVLKVGGSSYKNVTNFRIRWVVPPSYKTPVDTLLYNNQKETTLLLSPNKVEQGYPEVFSIGDMIVMAQCDFILDNKPSRVWLICESKREIPNTHSTRDNVKHLGDFDASLNNPNIFAEISKPNNPLKKFANLDWTKKNDKKLREFVVDFDGFKLMKKYANSEMSYLLCADFIAPNSGNFDLYLSSRFAKEVYLNGEKIENLKFKTSIKMRKGDNRILVVLGNSALKAKGIIFAVKDNQNFLECK